MSRDRAQPAPDSDGLGFRKEPGHGLLVLLDVREQLRRRQLLVELVKAENGELGLLEHRPAHPRSLHGPKQVQQVHAERLEHGGTSEGPDHADEGSALHGPIRRWERRPGNLDQCRLWDGDGLGPSLRAAAEPLPPTLGGYLSTPRFSLGGELPKYAHQPTVGLECSVTQHGELLGVHLTASFNLGEVGPVIGDALGQVLLVQPGFTPTASELLPEADGEQPDRLHVERACCRLLSLGGVGRWVTWCGVSPTWNRTGCHVTRL